MSSKNDKFPKFDKRALNEWMDTLFRDPFQRLLDAKSFRVDMLEYESAFVVEAELPGFQRDQIGIEVLDSALKISARHDEISEETNDNEYYYRRERSFGQFERMIPMPFRINPKQTTAEYHNGILRITIPKGDQDPERRMIDIE
ncbi:MAG TPA: Hsp20/alpha crystallin family protein [Bacillales bacterium]|nr:Hsp20/alpha crystallin family protein [Bacillales bacterium]